MAVAEGIEGRLDDLETMDFSAVEGDLQMPEETGVVLDGVEFVEVDESQQVMNEVSEEDPTLSEAGMEDIDTLSQEDPVELTEEPVEEPPAEPAGDTSVSSEEE
jgi:hypothetical protein